MMLAADGKAPLRAFGKVAGRVMMTVARTFLGRVGEFAEKLSGFVIPITNQRGARFLISRSLSTGARRAY